MDLNTDLNNTVILNNTQTQSVPPSEQNREEENKHEQPKENLIEMGDECATSSKTSTEEIVVINDDEAEPKRAAEKPDPSDKIGISQKETTEKPQSVKSANEITKPQQNTIRAAQSKPKKTQNEQHQTRLRSLTKRWPGQLQAPKPRAERRQHQKSTKMTDLICISEI